jgi:hypothetical protein
MTNLELATLVETDRVTAYGLIKFLEVKGFAVASKDKIKSNSGKGKGSNDYAIDWVGFTDYVRATFCKEYSDKHSD